MLLRTAVSVIMLIRLIGPLISAAARNYLCKVRDSAGKLILATLGLHEGFCRPLCQPKSEFFQLVNTHHTYV